VITSTDTPFRFGEANIFRLRLETDQFRDAFEVKLAGEYANENEQLTIVSCGAEVAEALRAAYILKHEHEIETRVVNMHTVKPLDRKAIVRAARETGAVMTAEEHQIGGLGNPVAGIILEDETVSARPVKFAMIGVRDRFGESGRPWQLIRKYGLAAEQIAEKAIELLGIK